MRTSWPGRKSDVDPACGVRHHERADAERTEHPDTEDDAIRADALVQVRPAAHHGHRDPTERAEHEHSRMPHGGGRRPARDLRVRDLDAVVELVGESTETAPEDDADPRLSLRRLPDPRDRGFEAHAEPSATRRS